MEQRNRDFSLLESFGSGPKSGWVLTVTAVCTAITLSCALINELMYDSMFTVASIVLSIVTLHTPPVVLHAHTQEAAAGNAAVGTYATNWGCVVTARHIDAAPPATPAVHCVIANGPASILKCLSTYLIFVAVAGDLVADVHCAKASRGAATRYNTTTNKHMPDLGGAYKW